MNKVSLKDCLHEVLIDAKDFLIEIPADLLSEEFILVGDQSQLESIEIVNILLALEEKLGSKLNKKIDCFDIIFSQEKSTLSNADIVEILWNNIEGNL